MKAIAESQLTSMLETESDTLLLRDQWSILDKVINANYSGLKV